MKNTATFKSLWIVSSLLISSFALKHTYFDELWVGPNQFTYEVDRHIVEKLFKKCHPENSNSQSWPQADNLTAPLLKSICDQVLYAFEKSYGNVERMAYEVPDPETVQAERVIKHAPVQLLDGVWYTSLMYCYYSIVDFYLAQGDDTHVFLLTKNTTEDNSSIYFLDSGYVVSILVTLFVVHGKYSIDRHEVEEMFKKMHPDMDHLDSNEWQECDNLTEESLKRICNELLAAVTPRFIPLKNFTYVAPPGKHPLHLERVIRRAPVKFLHIMEYTAYMTLIHCAFEDSSHRERDIYLAQADDKHVFRIAKNVNEYSFYFKSGLHPVNFTYT